MSLLKDASLPELRTYLHIQLVCLIASVVLLIATDLPLGLHYLAVSWWLYIAILTGIIGAIFYHAVLCKSTDRQIYERAVLIYGSLSIILLSYMLLFG